MQRVDDDLVPVVMPASYKPDWAERWGRKLKMEYVGMASVMTVVMLIGFGGLPRLVQAAIATAGTFFLFLGLKKKTRDHIAASFLLFAATALASPGVTSGLWFAPYALFGACIWAMEGYLEKRRGRINALPVVLGVFAAVSPVWVLGLAFVAAYLLQPRPEVPGLRKRLVGIVAVSAVAAAVVAVVVGSRGSAQAWTLAPPSGVLLVLYALVAVVTVLCLAFYWSRLAIPHRLNPILFGVLAPFDARFIAMFGMVSMVLLSATIFRHGIDSDRLRPAVKHAEWYFFPAVFAVALWAVFLR